MIGQLSVPGWAREVLSAYDHVLSELFWFALGFAVVFLVGQLVVIPFVTRVVRARNRNNPTIETATRTYLRVVLIAFAALTGIVTAGHGAVFSETAVIIAAVTFALGVAGQQVFGSLISGMFLVADPEFNVGDWIEWEDGRGTIEAIDFRVTRIRTPDHETVSVPNTELTDNAITRPYGRTRYRVTQEVYVAYDENTDRALRTLREVATTFEPALDEPTPNTHLVELGPNAVTIQAEFWIDDPRNRDIATIRSDFRRLVKRTFDEHGVTIAPPSGQSLSGEVTVRDPSPDGAAPGGA